MESKQKSPQFALVHNGPQLNEMYFKLYLHHTYSGEKQNQATIVERKLDNWFSKTVANDWPLYDGIGPDAKLVARAQGLRIQAGMHVKTWHNSFSIVFEDERFKGSSLQVMGPIVDNDELAIVGGTGEFPLANGVIYKNLHEQKPGNNIVELQIRAFYCPLCTGEPCWTLGI